MGAPLPRLKSVTQTVYYGVVPFLSDGEFFLLFLGPCLFLSSAPLEKFIYLGVWARGWGFVSSIEFCVFQAAFRCVHGPPRHCCYQELSMRGPNAILGGFPTCFSGFILRIRIRGAPFPVPSTRSFLLPR